MAHDRHLCHIQLHRVRLWFCGLLCPARVCAPHAAFPRPRVLVDGGGHWPRRFFTSASQRFFTSGGASTCTPPCPFGRRRARAVNLHRRQSLRASAAITLPAGRTALSALLYITGDGPKNGDYLDLNLLSAATGMPIAMLFNIPNQPIWGMKEDDLIAHTFNKYLETKDETWPLLFPMTKSAVSSLDVVQSVAKQNDLYIKNFVVTGASKRGWTTWLTAASQDKRIIGIAPMVFDNLKFNEQMKKQLADWGKYSDQIEDYTRRGLQQKLETPSGNDLLEMVDPYSYRKRINVPTLIVNGANDAYWTVDAHTRYWNDLKQPKWILELPNSGHGLEDRSRVVSTVGAFCRSLSGLFKMPTLSTKRKFDGPEPKHVIFEVKTTESEPLSLAIWKAESDSKDFRSSKWNEQRFEKGPVIQRDITEAKFNAMFVEARFSIEGRSFTISSPVEVLYGGNKPKKLKATKTNRAKTNHTEK